LINLTFVVPMSITQLAKTCILIDIWSKCCSMGTKIPTASRNCLSNRLWGKFN